MFNGFLFPFKDAFRRTLNEFGCDVPVSICLNVSRNLKLAVVVVGQLMLWCQKECNSQGQNGT